MKGPDSAVLVGNMAGEEAGVEEQSMMELAAAQLVTMVAMQEPMTEEVAVADCLQQLWKLVVGLEPLFELTLARSAKTEMGS